MRNQIYTKNTEYIACRQNLSKNLHFRKTFVYLGVMRDFRKQDRSKIKFNEMYFFPFPFFGNLFL